MATLASVSRVNFSTDSVPTYTDTITDIIMVREAETTHKFGDKPYLGFEHVTMVPMCRKLIDEALLTPDEKKWLNSYHAEVKEKTKHFFESSGDSTTLKWLERETQPY